MKTAPKVWRLWIPTTSSVGTSKYINFVRKSDYDRLLKRCKKLEKSRD